MTKTVNLPYNIQSNTTEDSSIPITVVLLSPHSFMNEVTVSISIKTLHCYVNLNFVAQYSARINAGLLSTSLCAMFSFWNTDSR